MVRVGSARKRAIFVLDTALRLIGEKESQAPYSTFAAAYEGQEH